MISAVHVAKARSAYLTNAGAIDLAQQLTNWERANSVPSTSDDGAAFFVRIRFSLQQTNKNMTTRRDEVKSAYEYAIEARRLSAKSIPTIVHTTTPAGFVPVPLNASRTLIPTVSLATRFKIGKSK